MGGGGVLCRTVFTPVMSVFRTDASFQNHLKKGILLNPTDYILPTEICAMVNVVLDAKNQSFKLCSIDGADSVSHSYILPPMSLVGKSIEIFCSEML